jgi:RecJ-like exonuclease
MIEKVESVVKEAKRLADAITSFPGEIRLVSHYDCDGICSAAIMVKALNREGKAFHLSFVKKLNDRKIDELANDERKLLIFTDLGSGKLDMIQEKLLNDKRRVVIIDHHQIQGMVMPQKKDFLLHLNPVQFGIEENISGSGVSYLVARAMSPYNRDLSELAIIGAIGDSQIGAIGPDWGLLGLNKEILKDAENMKKIRIERGLRLWGRYTRPVHKAVQYSTDPYIPGISGSESASVQFLQDLGIALKAGDEWRTLADLTEEEAQKLAGGIIKERVMSGEDNPEWIFGDVYELLDKKEEFRDANEFATVINACGKLSREFMAISMCFNNPDVAEEVRKALASYRREIGKSISVFEKNKEIIHEKPYGTYVMAGDLISEDIISNVISMVSRSGLVPENKPVFALVNTEDGEVKISARMIDTTVKYGLNEVLTESAAALGGEGGGHKFAAGATIPKGTEEMFINRMEEILKNLNGAAGVAAQAQNDEVLNNKDTEIVKSEVNTSGKAITAGGEEKGRGYSGGGKKMEGQGLVRYLNA